MDVCPEDFGDTELSDNWIETFGSRVATVWNAVDNKEMNVFIAAQVMEIADFFANPLRLIRSGRTNHNEIS